NSSRMSSMLARNSGSRPTISAPTRGPATDPTPPISTTSTNRIDWMKLKVLGVTNVDSGAYNPPAAPAQAADTAKATVFVTSGLMPTDSAAISLSLTARMAAPQVPRDSQV